MKPWEFLRGLGHGRPSRNREAEELKWLREQNVRLASTVEQASKALSAAPLWHSQHRIAMDILADAMERIEDEEAGDKPQ